MVIHYYVWYDGVQRPASLTYLYLVNSQVPAAALLIVGWSCKDLSMQNTKRVQMKPQFDEGVGSSGSSYKATLQHVSMHRPRLVMMENVPDVMSHADKISQAVVSV